MGLIRRILALGGRRKLDSDIREEMQAHLQMRIDDNLAKGMSQEEATRHAQLRFGNAIAIKERVTEADAALGFDSLWRDAQYAMRGFRKSPGFTFIAIAILALGIGANTAVFQLLDAVRLRSLPVQNPQELAEIRIVGGNQGFGINEGFYATLTEPIWDELRRHHEPFSGIFAWRYSGRLLGQMSDPHFLHGMDVSGEFFNVLGIHPWQGRMLLPEDEATACESPRVVVSYSFWQSHMGGKDLASGTTLIVDGRPLEVVGIVPPHFTGIAVGEGFDAAFPLCKDNPPQRNRFDIALMGRLKPGWTVDRATAYLNSLSAGIFADTAPTGYSTEVVNQYKSHKLAAYAAGSGISALRATYDTSLWLLLGITGLVLLIACANLANLMLARATTRQREMAVRMALGASRRRLLRQLLVESGLLAVAGGMLGIALSQFFSGVLVWSLSTTGGSIPLAVSTDWRVLLFVATIAILTCLVFGTLPTLRATRVDPMTSLKPGDKGMTGSRERFSMQRLMVVAQVSVSFVLLVGALLFVRSFRNLMTLDPGMRESGITVGFFSYWPLNIPQDHQAEFTRQLLEEVKAIPGIENAATTTVVPLNGDSWEHNIHVGTMEGKSKFTYVSPSYFATMQIPLLTGRNFGETDTATSPPVAVVNQTFIRRYLGGVNPIGQLIRTRPEPKYPETVYQVIGTIPDTRYNKLRGDTPPMAFVPATQYPLTAQGPGTAMMIASKDSSAAAATIKESFRQKHPEIILEFHNFTDQIHDSLVQERMMALLSGFFGALAVVLVMVGLYGVLSYLVAQRRSEIGIRIALGAHRLQVIQLILSEASRMLLIGLAMGTVLALFATRGASAILFGLKPYDPITLLFAIGLLVVISLLASWIPAYRAAGLDPAKALRNE